METSIETLRSADWKQLESDVVLRIRMLRATVNGLEPTPLNDRVANELILPAFRLLGEFCAAVELQETEVK